MVISSQYVRGNPLRYFPTCKVCATLSAPQTPARAVWTKVALDVRQYDVDSDFDTTNNRFVVPEDGYYLILGGIAFGNYPSTGKAYWAVLATDDADAKPHDGPNNPATGLYNMNQNVHDPYVSGVCAWVKVEQVAYLHEGKFVYLYGYQGDNTGDRTFDNVEEGTYLTVVRLA